jgi:hypothetical protein
MRRRLLSLARLEWTVANERERAKEGKNECRVGHNNETHGERKSIPDDLLQNYKLA